jgi:hypothetical protein
MARMPAARADALWGTATAAQQYSLDARLDPEKHEVYGTLRLALTNTSARALPSLLFHLYLNAFRNRQSVFMRESNGRLRGDQAHGTGGIELSSLRVAGQEVLATAVRELVPGDFSQLQVALPVPLAPGGKLLVEASFVAKLPPVFARSGYAGDFHVIAQWFPKLAKLEPSGDFVGFPYHGLSEFYADFADYDVTVRAPAEYQVFACGELAGKQAKGELVERRFKARRVHDFAWVASPSLVASTLRVGTVDVTFAAPASYELALIEHKSIVRQGLAHFGKRFGAYPYRTLTVVVPPRHADGAAGMEYPTMFVTAGNWFATPFAPSLSGAIVSAHELAHQWFYGLLASNEQRHPVLDEGLAEWATFDLLRALYGDTDTFARGLGIDRFEVERAGLGQLRNTSPGLASPAYAQEEYASSVYARAALALESVRRSFGKARFEQALALYAETNRFGHPAPDELATAFDHVYGAGFSSRVLRPLLFEGERSAVQIVEASSATHGKRFRSQVRARREGVQLPTWLSAYDRQGRELVRIAWPEGSTALNASFETKEPVARVALDADRALLLDGDVRDQSWLFRSDNRPLLGRLIAATQLMLSWLGP